MQPLRPGKARLQQPICCMALAGYSAFTAMRLPMWHQSALSGILELGWYSLRPAIAGKQVTSTAVFYLLGGRWGCRSPCLCIQPGSTIRPVSLSCACAFAQQICNSRRCTASTMQRHNSWKLNRLLSISSTKALVAFHRCG